MEIDGIDFKQPSTDNNDDSVVDDKVTLSSLNSMLEKSWEGMRVTHYHAAASSDANVKVTTRSQHHSDDNNNYQDGDKSTLLPVIDKAPNTTTAIAYSPTHSPTTTHSSTTTNSSYSTNSFTPIPTTTSPTPIPHPAIITNTSKSTCLFGNENLKNRKKNVSDLMFKINNKCITKKCKSVNILDNSYINKIIKNEKLEINNVRMNIVV